MKTAWQIKDLIDLEYFLHADETTGDEPQEYEATARRDRDIYLEHIGPLTGKGESLPRRFIIKKWLEKRRSAEKIARGPDSILPGEAFFEVHRILLYALVISGFLIGSGLAFSLLTYKGTHPLNVSVYLGVLVMLQILLLLLLGAISLVRLVKRPFFHGSVVFSLISGLLVKLILKLRGEALRMLPGDRRMGLEAAVGLVRGRGRVYGSLFYWPVFILAQVFGELGDKVLQRSRRIRELVRHEGHQCFILCARWIEHGLEDSRCLQIAVAFQRLGQVSQGLDQVAQRSNDL